MYSGTIIYQTEKLPGQDIAMLNKYCNCAFVFFALIITFDFFAVCKAEDGKLPNMAKTNNKSEARLLFGQQRNVAVMSPEVFGSYARGCLGGARQLAVNGENWQAMRLSRNRNWAHPEMLLYIEKLATDAANMDGWPGLLVGDISQPKGGPMLSGHKSHQVGLDVDIWLRPSPQKKLSFNERESMSSISVIEGPFKLNRKAWTDNHARLLKRAASYSEVARIFVHPTIKKELCTWAGEDRAWLKNIRAWYGHHYHFHVRLKCPDNEKNCENQPPPPPGDGCGEELTWWLSEEAYQPKPAKKTRKALTLQDLPSYCRTVLESD